MLQKGGHGINRIDFQNNDYDFLIQIIAEQDAADILEKAMACDLFTAIEEGKSLADLASLLVLDEKGTLLFLDVLDKLGMVISKEGYVCNAPVSTKYLTKASPFDSLNAVKNGEISSMFIAEKLLPMLANIRGNVYLENISKQVLPSEQTFPSVIQDVIMKNDPEISCNHQLPYDLVITGANFATQTETLAPNGIIGVMGTFVDAYSLHTALRLYHSYVNKTDADLLSLKDVTAYFENKQLQHTPLFHLTRDISVIFASKNADSLNRISVTAETQLRAKLSRLPIQSVTTINPNDVVTAHWVKDHCRYGCSSYGEKCCPPNSPTYEETRIKFEGYTRAFLIEGQPPTRDFQHIMLKAEKIAFKEGFYKAFAFWAGPCHICDRCEPPAPPKKCTATRPSMESAGIDVFATVAKYGFHLRTLKDKREFAKYFGLLLLE
ncbi:DUF2284 domain-containing protein [Dehalobacter sp. DCM]|uniref:DUF2284 domain-containing protein n=1 Tax=Dehalobacter sp. DCM TaxID=2907827 RepID=UPI0030817867|nr:DUF2284 domain-containing protein [Dehalobacter sp. DCM]